MAPFPGRVTVDGVLSPGASPSGGGPTPAASSAAWPGFALRLAGGTKSYERGRRRIPVFADVDLELRRDEIVVLLGPSGCGKSTLLRTLAGLEPLDRGRIEVGSEVASVTVGDPAVGDPAVGDTAVGDPAVGDPAVGGSGWDGVRVSDGRPSEPGHAIGIAFQEPSLLPWLTVAENVGLGLRFAANRGPVRIAGSTGVAELLVELGLADLADARPDQLSGGQAQRVNVARVVLTGRPILLLDEPFAALDPATRSDLQGWLVRLVRAHRLAALLVTHDVDEALAVGDRIVLMAGQPGRIRRAWRPERRTAARALRAEILAAYRADASSSGEAAPATEGPDAMSWPADPVLDPSGDL